MCGLTQHAGLAFNVKDHRVNTRTVILNPILSWLYIKLEYHIEHHNIIATCREREYYIAYRIS